MFVCPISQEPIQYVAEITTCGHLFEYQALITSLYHGSRICPMCRAPFEFENVYHSPTLQKLICGVKSSISTQTDEVPALLTDAGIQTDAQPSLEDAEVQTSSVGEPTENPFINVLSIISDGHIDDTPVNHYYSPDQNYFRVVNMDQAYVNPNSTTVADDEYVIDQNRRFNGMIGLYKYAYQTLDGNVTSVAHTLADTGYLVYDIFCLNPTTPRPLYRYVVYSSPLKVNKVRHYLSRYARRGDC